ncbi:MAG: PPOX class F420-dependent oxidoreductase [Lapillicoccus sp.]
MPDSPRIALAPEVLALLGARNLGSLATIRSNGRPQLSVVNFAWSPLECVARTSTRSNLAKVANLRRDPRVSLMLISEDGWSYAVLEGQAELSPVAQAREDDTVDQLVDLYRSIAGKDHPDWDDYRRAMVDDGRLVLSVVVERAYGPTRG